MEKIHLKDDFIKLGQALKLAGLVDSGVEAKIVIQDGKTKLVNIKNQDTITKILDLVPDVVDRFTSKKEERMSEKDVMDILDSENEGKEKEK